MKLQPCPFCGSEPRLIRFDSYKEAVICDTCGGRGPSGIYDRDAAARGWNRRTPAAPPEPHPCPGYPTWEKPEFAIHCDGCSHPNARPPAATPGTAPTPPGELVTIRGCCEQATQLMSDGREAWSYCPVHGKTPAVLDAGTPRGDE